MYIYGDNGGSTSCSVSQVTSPLSIGVSIGRLLGRICKTISLFFSIGYIHVRRFHILDKRIFFKMKEDRQVRRKRFGSFNKHSNRLKVVCYNRYIHNALKRDVIFSLR